MIPISREENPVTKSWVQLAENEDQLVISFGNEWFLQGSLQIPPDIIPMLINSLLELTMHPFEDEEQ